MFGGFSEWMDDLDFDVPESLFRDSLAICNDIVSLDDQELIEQAALIAHDGEHHNAEAYRKAAGYGGCSYNDGVR